MIDRNILQTAQMSFDFEGCVAVKSTVIPNSDQHTFSPDNINMQAGDENIENNKLNQTVCIVE